MNINKLMSANVVTVKMDDSLSTVKEIFEKTNFHHLLVVEDSRLFGVISDRDLLKAISPKIGTEGATIKDLATLNKKVHQIMTRQPITLHESATVQEAVDIFNQNKISCIPIINNTNQPVGILSWRDIMKVIKSK